MNKFKPLYKYDSKQRQREWWVFTEGPKVTVRHGLVLGKKTVKSTISKAKNTGKANATTAEEQAIKDAQSKWNAQVLREDYNVDIEKSGRQMRPMLALDYKNVPHRVGWSMVDTLVQAKLDGLRLTTGQRDVGDLEYDPSQPIEMLSRKGETYELPHLTKHCGELLEHINDKYANCLALDGEVYIHGMPLGQIVSRARKYQPGVTEELEYYIFDLVIPGMRFSERAEILLKAMDDLNSEYPFRLVTTHPCTSEKEMKEYHNRLIGEGYEGVMVRPAWGPYTIGDRSDSLFKYKEFFDKECKIVGMQEDANGNAVLTCLWNSADPTSDFRCTPKRTHSERAAMLLDSTLVGKWITVKYQAVSYATHPGGLPTFNTGLDIRECDDNGEPIV
jgi:DNA ligase-1